MKEGDAGEIEPLLRKLERFQPLSEDDRSVLLPLGAEAYDVPANTDLIAEGDPPEGVFLILKGFAGRYKLRENGRRMILAYLLPGDCCDLDVALLSHMDHGIAALSACRVSRIAPERIGQLLQRPSLARALRTATLVDEATAREWLVNVGRRTALERVAHLLCEMHARLQVVGLVKDRSFDLGITQDKLGDTLGLSAVHVNRMLQELRVRRLITLRDRRLTVLNLTQLQAVAEFRANYLHLDAWEGASHDAPSRHA